MYLPRKAGFIFLLVSLFCLLILRPTLAMASIQGTWKLTDTYTGSATQDFTISCSGIDEAKYYEVYIGDNLVGERVSINSPVRTIRLMFSNPALLEVKLYSSSNSTSPIATGKCLVDKQINLVLNTVSGSTVNTNITTAGSAVSSGSSKSSSSSSSVVLPGSSATSTTSASTPAVKGTLPKDISNHWAYQPVAEWVQKGLVKGYADGSFKPDQLITRAEFVTMVNRYYGYSEQKIIQLSDVKASDWFADQIAIAAAAGYVSGYPDGKFMPEMPITRLEVATVAAKLSKKQTADLSGLNQFKDNSQIASWGKNYLAVSLNQGLIKGYPDGTCRPEQAITRAESIVILSRLNKGN